MTNSIELLGLKSAINRANETLFGNDVGFNNNFEERERKGLYKRLLEEADTIYKSKNSFIEIRKAILENVCNYANCAVLIFTPESIHGYLNDKAISGELTKYIWKLSECNEIVKNIRNELGEKVNNDILFKEIYKRFNIYHLKMMFYACLRDDFEKVDKDNDWMYFLILTICIIFEDYYRESLGLESLAMKYHGNDYKLYFKAYSDLVVGGEQNPLQTYKNLKEKTNTKENGMAFAIKNASDILFHSENDLAMNTPLDFRQEILTNLITEAKDVCKHSNPFLEIRKKLRDIVCQMAAHAILVFTPEYISANIDEPAISGDLRNYIWKLSEINEGVKKLRNSLGSNVTQDKLSSVILLKYQIFHLRMNFFSYLRIDYEKIDEKNDWLNFLVKSFYILFEDIYRKDLGLLSLANRYYGDNAALKFGIFADMVSSGSKDPIHDFNEMEEMVKRNKEQAKNIYEEKYRNFNNKSNIRNDEDKWSF